MKLEFEPPPGSTNDDGEPWTYGDIADGDGRCAWFKGEEDLDPPSNP